MTAPHVAVVGLGAMGAAISWHLARGGARVTGLDARDPPHAFGSTHGHSRIIREAYFEHPQYVPMVQQAYRGWAEIEAAARTRLFQPSGGLMIGAEGSTLVEGAAASAARHGLPVERWSAADVRRRVPVLQPSDDAVALFEPRAGILAPERAVRAMLDLARQAGAHLGLQTAVRGWSAHPGGVAVDTDAGAVQADHLVLAAGPWLPGLVADLRLPLQVERAVQYWYATGGEPGYRPAALPVFMIETAAGRLLYGLPDQGQGLKLAEHHGGAAVTADGVPRDVTPAEREAFDRLARPIVRLPDGGPATASVCLYTNTPDGHFVLDRHPASDRVYIVSACSGHGFKFAPAIGAAVAAELTGAPAPWALDPFRLSRFAGSRG